MVAKHLHDMIKDGFGYLLAKIHMVAKRIKLA